MSTLNKIIAGTIIGGLAISGYAFVKRLKRTQAELQIILAASIYKLSLEGITIRLDVLMKNPTKGTFSIMFPFVKLTYKDTLVGSSQVVNKEITIPAFGEAKIDKILVEIPMLSIFSVSTSLLKAIQNKESVKLVATVSTTVHLGFISKPFEYSKELVLNK